LSHTAGTTVHGFEGYSTTALRPTPIETLNGIPPANNSAIVVDAIPGLQARYSGGGTTIAQQVVTDVSGQPLPELMRELVLDPLEMTHSTFEQPLPARFTPSAAVAHSWNGEPVHGGWHVYPEMAAAGLWTTADDLARLGVELMRILRGDDSSLGLDRDAISAMLRPQLPDQRAGQEFWGLGWLCNADGDAFRFGHGGRNNGYVSVITLLPARGQGAVVLLNSSRGFPLRSEIVAAIGRQYGWPPVENVQTIAPTLSHDDYTGVYSDPQGFTFHVTQTEQELRLNFGDQMPLALRPVSSMEFVVGALDAQVRFAASEDNSIISMTVIQGGKVITASRQ
jgi:CubicO group peptidase (beta-lactamase class C family)